MDKENLDGPRAIKVIRIMNFLFRLECGIMTYLMDKVLIFIIKEMVKR